MNGPYLRLEKLLSEKDTIDKKIKAFKPPDARISKDISIILTECAIVEIYDGNDYVELDITELKKLVATLSKWGMDLNP